MFVLLKKKRRNLRSILLVQTRAKSLSYPMAKRQFLSHLLGFKAMHHYGWYCSFHRWIIFSFACNETKREKKSDNIFHDDKWLWLALLAQWMWMKMSLDDQWKMKKKTWLLLENTPFTTHKCYVFSYDIYDVIDQSVWKTDQTQYIWIDSVELYFSFYCECNCNSIIGQIQLNE